jgi:DNA repair exonuclease SbcCD nuclease subunit
MGKIAIITDTHSGVRNDAFIFHDYFKKSLDSVFFPYIEKYNIQDIIHCGDVFDRRKYLNIVTLTRCREDFLDKLRDKNVHIIIGNHDTYYKDTNRVNSLQEIIKEKYPYNIYTSAKEVVIQDLPILFVPWICEENAKETFETIKKSKAQICFGHLELAGFEMHKGIFAREALDSKIFKKFELVCSGHFHHQSVKSNIKYLGAFMEFSWSDYNDPRGFHVFDTETRELEFIKNPISIYKMIAYDDTQEDIIESFQNIDFNQYKGCYVKIVVVAKTNAYAFDLFLDKLYKAEPQDISIIEDMSQFTDLDPESDINQAEDTPTIIDKFIDTLSLPVNNRKMKYVMRSIYNEAITVENV